MDENPTPLDRYDAELRFAELLKAADLPLYTRTVYDPELQALEFHWSHGLTLHMDLSRGEVEPIDEWERNAILDEGPLCECEECAPDVPIHVYVPGSADDPRDAEPVPGVEIHRGPPLHPDDVTTVRGIPVTSPSRTLIDLAEVMTADELRDTFARAQRMGMLDPDALRAARGRVEWRPSLAMLDEVIAEFCD
jgi:hypothetical protein